MGFSTIVNQIIILAILTLCGTIAYRLKILQDSAKNVIEKLVFYITLPLLIVTKLSSLDFTVEILRNGGIVIISTYLILFIQVLVGKISAKLLMLRKQQAVIHSLHSMMGNIVFLGFPLLDTLFPGGEAILYAALYQLVVNTVMWSYGVYHLNPNTKEKGLSNLKKLINPNTIALCIGLLMMILRIRFPQLLQVSLGGLGSTTLYLAMIYIGILLAQTKIREMIKSPSVYVLSFNKLFLLPVVFIFLFKFVFQVLNLEINAIAFSVLILESAMPCMVILVLLAKRYGGDDKLAMKNFFVSTIISLLSLPFVLYMLEIFGI
ncbi:MAG: AEC family transporter [Bacteroidales bacterium]|nr:AEC family transporter [Bacteroidales bacterium]